MRNRSELSDESIKNEHVEICTTCTLPNCIGGHKGCPFIERYGKNATHKHLFQNSCGFPDPDQLAIRNEAKNRKNYELRKKRARKAL